MENQVNAKHKHLIATILFHTEGETVLDLLKNNGTNSMVRCICFDDQVDNGVKSITTGDELREYLAKNNMIFTGLKAKYQEERWRLKEFNFVDSSMIIESAEGTEVLGLSEYASNFQNIAHQLDVPFSKKYTMNELSKIKIQTGKNEFGKISLVFDGIGERMKSGIPETTIVVNEAPTVEAIK